MYNKKNIYHATIPLTMITKKNSFIYISKPLNIKNLYCISDQNILFYMYKKYI